MSLPTEGKITLQRVSSTAENHALLAWRGVCCSWHGEAASGGGNGEEIVVVVGVVVKERMMGEKTAYPP